MVIQYVEPFHIPYLDEATPLNELDTVTRELAIALNAAMGRAGYTGADSTDFVALSNKATLLRTDVDALKAEALVRKRVVQYVDQGGSPFTYPAAAVTTHTQRTVDPTALFGAGWGALVEIDARMLFDGSTANPRGDFWLSSTLTANGSGVSTDLCLDSTSCPQRGTFALTYTDVINPNELRRYRTRVDNPSTSLVSYGSAAHNRTRYTIRPYKP